MSKPKILLYDLETSPLIGYSWQTYDTNLIEVIKDWELLSFSYKWLGQKTVRCETRAGQKTDKALIKKLHALFDEADIIVAHNGDKFDRKKSNARSINVLLPPAPYLTVDTLKIAKRNFAFTSNRLNDLAQFLGIGTKAHTGGFKLWKGCMANDPKSWAIMEKYNKKDVNLLEQVYLKLRPWDNKHPNVAPHNVVSCTKCPGGKLQKRGFDRTKAGVFQRFVCTSCGGWCRSTVKEKGLRRMVVNL